MEKILFDYIDKTRDISPLVLNLTNYVTINDCANAQLAVGGSPVMSVAMDDAVEIASKCSAVVINIGTLSLDFVSACIECGKTANRHCIPVVLDPCGVGFTTERNQAVERLLSEVKFTVIRGNYSELAYLVGMNSTSKGVDSAGADVIEGQMSGQVVAQKVSQKFECIACVTGKIDYISNGKQVVCVSNGNEFMSKITGTGCQASAIIGVYSAVIEPFLATTLGIISMGVAGDNAKEKYINGGSGSMRVGIMDSLSHQTAVSIENKANYQIIDLG